MGAERASCRSAARRTAASSMTELCTLEGGEGSRTEGKGARTGRAPSERKAGSVELPQAEGPARGGAAGQPEERHVARGPRQVAALPEARVPVPVVSFMPV